MTSTTFSRTDRNDQKTISTPLGLKISGNTPTRQQMEKPGLRFHRLLIQTAGPVWRVLPLTVQRMVLRCALPKVSLGVCAVVEDAAGRLLVVRHSYRKQPWGLPGGFVRRGEEPAAALLREIREELGVEDDTRVSLHHNHGQKTISCHDHLRLSPTTRLSICITA